MVFKKEILKSMIEEGKVKACTIVGKPTQELIDNFLDRSCNMFRLYKKYDIDGEFYIENNIRKESRVVTCMPYKNGKHTTERCSIVINYPSLEDIDNIRNLFEYIEEYYQVDVHPKYIDSILNLNDESLDFADMINMIPEKKQTEIAKKINKSKQLITDIKSGKNRPSFDVLRALMREYPLLPWDSYIRGF